MYFLHTLLAFLNLRACYHSSYGVDERLELRSQRLGLPLDGTDIRKASALRYARLISTHTFIRCSPRAKMHHFTSIYCIEVCHHFSSILHSGTTEEVSAFAH
jgi:hypothetical protein